MLQELRRRSTAKKLGIVPTLPLPQFRCSDVAVPDLEDSRTRSFWCLVPCYQDTLPLKTPSPKPWGSSHLLQTEKAHVTQKVEKSVVFLRGKTPIPGTRRFRAETLGLATCPKGSQNSTGSSRFESLEQGYRFLFFQFCLF